MKTGIIDVGGGFRDIYGAGILDVCMERGIEFDYCICISAGSANLASVLARQHGRNYTFYMEYVFRKEYASPENWLRTRNYVDLDYVYSTLSNSDGENPIDYEAIEANPAEFYIGACDARTGKPVYVPRSPEEKAMQRALLQFRRPQNFPLVREALRRAGREDLIGTGRNCLVQPEGVKTAHEYAQIRRERKAREERRAQRGESDSRARAQAGKPAGKPDRRARPGKDGRGRAPRRP